MNPFIASRRWVLLTGASLLCLCASLTAEILYSLNDPVDDPAVLISLRNDARLLNFGKEVEAVRKRLLEWQEDDFLNLFGSPTNRTSGLTGASGVRVGDGFAILSTESRLRALAGLRCTAPECNKDHFDTYAVGDMARLEVVYQPNGTTPADFVFQLKMDRDFVKLDRAENLEMRLAWERTRFNEMVKRIYELWRLKVVWEVDVEAQSKQFQGLNSWDGAERLAAVRGFLRQQDPQLAESFDPATQSQSWQWYSRDFKLVGEASQRPDSTGRLEISTVAFSYPNGLTVDYTRQGSSIMIRWSRAPNARLQYIEYATLKAGRWMPIVWGWLDENGNEVRTERDTNGDGLPDRYRKMDSPRTPLLPLSVDLSWAVHPELIPEGLRVPDQESRRLPIRRIPD